MAVFGDCDGSLLSTHFWVVAVLHTNGRVNAAAITYALKKRNYPKGVLFHTDRGVEYAGGEFQKILKENGFKHSLNRPGHCTDNALMESFFHNLKAELIRGTIYRKATELRRNLSTCSVDKVASILSGEDRR